MPFKDKERASTFWQAYHAANREKRWIQQKARRSANPAKLAYHRQKRHAKERGIKFLLTFEEWQAVWAESGKWEQRGRRRGQYVMSRFGDIGPYAVGNVSICLAQENVQEGSVNRTKESLQRQAISLRETWARKRARHDSGLQN